MFPIFQIFRKVLPMVSRSWTLLEFGCSWRHLSAGTSLSPRVMRGLSSKAWFGDSWTELWASDKAITLCFKPCFKGPAHLLLLHQDCDINIQGVFNRRATPCFSWCKEAGAYTSSPNPNSKQLKITKVGNQTIGEVTAPTALPVIASIQW